MTHTQPTFVRPYVPALRRRQQFSQRLIHGRAAAERLLTLIDFLPAADRELMRAVFADGRSAASIARMAGRSPLGVQRRIVNLLDRIESPQFAIVVTHAELWPERRAAIARVCIIEGLSMRTAARRMNLTVHQVRLEMVVIRSLMASIVADRRERASPLTVRRTA